MSLQTGKENSTLMPAEWEKHSATWLAWPNDKDFFQDRFEKVEGVYVEIIKALHKDELIKLLVLNQSEQERISSLLTGTGVDLSRVVFCQTDYVDVWIRDYGPTFVKNRDGLRWVKWNYDGYDKKFPELLQDNKVFFDLKNVVGFEMRDAKIAMEGGGIETNGMGTILTTEECLINNRDIGNKEEIESLLNKFIGAKNIIWLNKGLTNDHTDGHIDEVARFVSPSKILCAYEDDIKDENYEILSENIQILEHSLDQDGNKFEIIKLPMPHYNYDDGTKAPVSYANFYIANKVVLVSVFKDENDKKAISIIKSCFPEKEIIPIDCRDLIYGGGALHCITQQEPVL